MHLSFLPPTPFPVKPQPTKQSTNHPIFPLQLKAWYLKMETTTSSSNLDELSSMNPLQLADIAKEYSFLDFDWRTLDAFFAADGCCTWGTMWV